MRKIGRALFPLMFFSLMLPSLVWAGVQLEATVDRNKINEGEALTLTISVTSDESFNLQEPRLPSLEGFQLINQWSGSEARSTFSGGKFQTVRTRRFNYRLAVPRKGKYLIGKAEVIVNGKAYYSKPISVQVYDGGAPSARSAPNVADSMADVDDLFNQLLGGGFPGRQRQRVERPVNNGDVIIHMVVDKKKVYVGEQVTATWYLDTTAQIRDIDTLKYPKLSGFWKEEIEVATHLNFKRRVVNGVAMRGALLASYALFPIKAGETLIDAYEAKVTAINSRGLIGFGRPQSMVKKSQTAEIEVLPLPPGAPENFVGTVGNYEVSAKLDVNEVTVNQPFTLQVRFEGTGNAKLIELPELEIPDNLELYDTKKEAKFFKDGRSYKEFNILLIPRMPGRVDLPGFEVSFFDPKTEKYVRKSTHPLSIVVRPGKADEMIPSSPVAAKPQVEEERDVWPSEVLAWGSFGQFDFLDSGRTWAIVYLLLFFGLFMKARKDFGWGKRLKSLSDTVQKRVSKIRDLAGKEQWRQVGVESTNLLYFILGEITGEGGANVELSKLILKAPPSVRRELGVAIEKLMNEFQILSFAPEAVVGNLKEKENLVRLCQDMEKVMLRAVALGVTIDSEELGENVGDSVGSH